VSAYTHKQIGQLGEDIACRFLQKRGFTIEERNYLKKWGEIDIIARKGAVSHVIEVKTVQKPQKANGERNEAYRPEENVHPQKLKRIRRALQSYLLEGGGVEWQFDVLAVTLDVHGKRAECLFLENLTL
jgi:putative endonuclease